MELVLIVALTGWVAISIVIAGLCAAAARGDAVPPAPRLDDAPRFARDGVAARSRAPLA